MDAQNRDLCTDDGSVCLGADAGHVIDEVEIISPSPSPSPKESSAEYTFQSSTRAASETEATDDSHIKASAVADADQSETILADMDAFWRRPQNCQFIEQFHEDRSKMTPDGCKILGDNLWNFFLNVRAPELLAKGTITSSDLMRAQLLRLGKLASSKDKLSKASDAPDLEQLFPFSVGVLVCGAEYRHDDQHPTSSANSLPALQERLPFHMFPEKLIVHDPCDTLSASSRSQEHCAEKEDVIRAYKLLLDDEGDAKKREDRVRAEQSEEGRVERAKDEWRVFYPKCNEDGVLLTNYAIHAKVPPRPSRPTSVPEAHLYIHCSDRVGEGNHSVVYDVQLELPRWALCEDVLCESCWWAAFNDAMDENAAALVPLSKEESCEMLMCETMSEPPAESSLDLSRNAQRLDEGFCEHRDNPFVTDHVHTNGAQKPKDPEPVCEDTTTTNPFSGPILRIYPKVEWQRPGVTAVCEHVALPGKGAGVEGRPARARVRVCAKLSHEYDSHLEQESSSYQAFPPRFYEHWTGSEILSPLSDPTARGAIVPQFYGYYTREEERVRRRNCEGKSEDDRTRYWSPLLLLENCGQQIDVSEMSEDERKECASLYIRMQRRGWTQGSVYPRNVLWQNGPIVEYPLQGAVRTGRRRVFRLIDFGRAQETSDSSGSEQCTYDRDKALKLFELGPYARE